MSQFDRFATDYKSILDRSVALSGADSEYFAEAKAQYVALLVGRQFAGTVLDFGCGIGLVSRALKRHLPAATMHGYDESQASVEMVDSDIRAKGLYTSESRDLGSDYDLIIVANVLHHVVPDKRQALCNELRSRLGPDGRLIVFEHNPLNPLTRWVVNRCPLDQDAILLPPKETIGYLRRAGFSSVCTAYVIFFPRQLLWVRPLERWLGWCPLGAQYVVQSRKDRKGSSR